MEKLMSALPSESTELVDLGVTLGQNFTYALVAGRSSAAQARCLQQLRAGKRYLRCSPSWESFCSTHLRICRTEADKLIHLWEEFGAGYFEVAQLTRISADTYRAIAPAIHDGVLHFNGDAIELNAENSRRVAAAVAELRSTLPPRKPPRQLETHQLLADLDKRCAAILAEFQDISRKERHGENWLLFTAVLSRVYSGLGRLVRENGIQ